ncbi:SGNH/GDSL hydrolase family protein [Nocardia cerradoensis]|uniref:Lipase 2 n=2 Tax=Nocardia cerradoensis TaxID=85688 RepID=A0A231H219_9NOCA|nr:SGNH/GDSL hydrolase family protein [Nocardia cerradoensis]NKY41855.1 SGNH/GDSL hydrolase family protein [Nocardia cerradoensis]OXR42893.1 Lipase 2 [Nocardia cerradoensis]
MPHRTTRTLALLALAGAAGLAPTHGAAAADTPRDAEYVSLGDSYVAVGSNLNTYNRDPDCGTAPDNVGHLVAAQLHGVSFDDRACGGADTSDITSTTTRSDPQIDGLSPKTRYVSISLGGNNDNVFGEIVNNCLMASHPADTCTPQFRADEARKLDDLGQTLDSAYTAIRTKAPNATIIVLGYTRILPDSVQGCFAAPMITQSLVDIGNDLQHQLDDVVTAAARRAGFVMVNQWDAQDDHHSICAPLGQTYVSMTGLLPTEQGTPVHPTIQGRRYAAQLIAHAFLATTNTRQTTPTG